MQCPLVVELRRTPIGQRSRIRAMPTSQNRDMGHPVWGPRAGTLQAEHAGGDEEEKDGGSDAYVEGGATGAGKFLIVGADGAEFDEPADDHERDGDAEEPKTDDADVGYERDKAEEEEAGRGPGHDLEVATVAAGLIDLRECFG